MFQYLLEVLFALCTVQLSIYLRFSSEISNIIFGLFSTLLASSSISSAASSGPSGFWYDPLATELLAKLEIAESTEVLSPALRMDCFKILEPLIKVSVPILMLRFIILF